MPCTKVGNAIVCGPRQKPKPCVGCGERMNPRQMRQCDARIKGTNGKTCDKFVCVSCTHVPAPGKDLCPDHAAQWKARAQ